jgi:outer membrane receptor protein involved in Fe transport
MMILSFCGICLASLSYAGTIKGKINDARTGEPMAGATVVLEHTHYTTIVNLDGTFIFRHIPAGKYEVVATTIGYNKSKEIDVELSSDNDTRSVSISLSASSNLLDEVLVTGATNGESEKGARRMEQRADVIQNVLSARAIQISPDVTVANSLQRISGITIQRDNAGEGRYVIIRGMSQRYNNTLVNGIKIPSPDDKFRFVPMDIFPSEMLERLEVTKALTPNMEGDAIGGTMNLVMKNAPDQFLLTANVSAGYSTLFSNRPFSAFPHSSISIKSPAELYGNSFPATAANFPLSNLHFYNKSNPINGTVGMTIGDRFLNKRLGVVLSASYQNFFRGSNSEYLIPSAQPNLTSAGNPAPAFTDAYDRQYSTQTNRIGIHNKIDYVINGRNKISLYNLYLHQNDFETRYTPDTTVGTNSSNSSKSVQVEYRSRWQIQDIYNATLHGDHQLGKQMKLDWSGVYSIATKKVPDMASYNFNANVKLDPSGKITQIDSTLYSAGADRVWQHNKDQDWSGYLNLIYTPHLLERAVEFAVGGLYRYKTRDNYYNEYGLGIPVTIPASTPFQSIDQMPLTFPSSSAGEGVVTTILHANNYTTHEKTAAGYIQAKLLLTRSLQLLGGVRVENTQQDYTTNMPATFNARQGTIHYTDLLPSAHLKYFLDQRQNIRLSYFKSLSRPGYGEIIPTQYPGEYYSEIGNPYLKHTRADNFDLRYEWFPSGSNQLLLGAFYKDLQNPIETFVTRDGGPSALYLQPQNVNKATNYGFEAVFTQFFGMFGVSANYTYTHSKVTTAKLLYHYVNGFGIRTDSIFQTRPLQGQANNVGNLSLLFKDSRIGLDMQLAFVYTGDLIQQVNPYYGMDTWQKPYTQLDFSLEKRLNHHFYFYTKVNNLTNSHHKLYMKFTPASVNQANAGPALPYQTDSRNTIVQNDIYKTSFLGGFRYKF